MITRDTILDYLDDMRAHPENYVEVGQIVREVTTLRAIRRALTIKALNEIFQPAAKKAKADGDAEAVKLFTEAAAKRKGELCP
jgi:radical SAM superfamily enzyme